MTNDTAPSTPSAPHPAPRPVIGLLFDQLRCDDERLFAQLAAYEIRDLRGFRSWPDREARIAAEVRGCDVLLTNVKTPTLPTALVEDPGKLRYICHTRGVVKAYFPRGLLEKGILLTNWGDQAKGIAERALAILLSQLHQVTANHRICSGESITLTWQSFPSDFASLCVGVYGCGNIGRHFVHLARGLGMTVRVFDPYAAALPEGTTRCTSLDELFANCQAISIHCGLSAATHGSVNASRLALLPDGGIVVNTARGAVVVEADLAAEVARGRLLAGCDVIEQEGGKDGISGWCSTPLARLPGAVLTGHGGNKPTPPLGYQPAPWVLPPYAEQNLRAFLTGGSLLHRISLEQYDRTT